MKTDYGKGLNEPQDAEYPPMDFKKILIGALMLVAILIVVRFFF